MVYLQKQVLLGLCLCISVIGCGKENTGTGDPGWTAPLPKEKLVVMSYNIRHCSPYNGTSMTPPPDIDGVVKVLKLLKPDVVLFQEVDSMTKRCQGVDQAKELARRAGYPYYKFFRQKAYQGGAYGAGILSRYKMENITNHPLQKVFDGYTMTGSNIMGSIEIEVEGKRIRMVTTHLSAKATERPLQFPGMLKILTSSNLPTIVGGDFNSKPGSEIIKALDDAGLQRTTKDPTKLTIPSTTPTSQIDYIAFYPKTAFRVISHAVITGTQASDHLPIVTVLSIK